MPKMLILFIGIYFQPHLRWSQGVITDIFSESKLRLLNLFEGRYICLPKSYRRWHLLRSWLFGHLGQPPRTTLIQIKREMYCFWAKLAFITCSNHALGALGRIILQ